MCWNSNLKFPFIKTFRVTLLECGGDGAQWEVFGSLGVCLKVDCRSHDHPPPPFHFPALRWAVWLCCTTDHNARPHHRPQHNERINHGLELPKLQAKRNCFNKLIDCLVFSGMADIYLINARYLLRCCNYCQELSMELGSLLPLKAWGLMHQVTVPM